MMPLLNPIKGAMYHNERVHMDLFGPLMSHTPNRYVLVITDAFSKYTELVPIADKEAKTVAQAFINRWLLRYGSPLQVVTDGGKEFVNSLAKEMYEIIDTLHSTTSPYHPQTNGQVESFNKTMGHYLRAMNLERQKGDTLAWELLLPGLAFSYNTSVHTSTKVSPAMLLFGFEPRIPAMPTGPLYNTDSAQALLDRYARALDLARHANETARETYTNAYNKINKCKEECRFFAGDSVWLRIDAQPRGGECQIKTEVGRPIHNSEGVEWKHHSRSPIIPQ
jgi:transposase InsO family protein